GLVLGEDCDALVVGVRGGSADESKRQGCEMEGARVHVLSPLRVMLSRNTASTTIAPVTTGCQLELIASRFMPLSTRVRNSTPTARNAAMKYTGIGTPTQYPLPIARNAGGKPWMVSPFMNQ